MFCAPSAMPLPLSTAETSVSHGNGGHTTISTASVATGASERASALASSRVVFIFQFPTTMGLATRPHRHGAGGKPARAILNRVRGPALDRCEIFDQLQSVA